MDLAHEVWAGLLGRSGEGVALLMKANRHGWYYFLLLAPNLCAAGSRGIILQEPRVKGGESDMLALTATGTLTSGYDKYPL